MSIANPYFYGHEEGSGVDAALKKKAAVASLTVASILIGTKFYAFIATDSVSLLSSLMDSFFDALASFAILLSVSHASTPADDQHRFGHGKMEALGALAQALFISGSGIFLLVESARRFVDPQQPQAATVGLAVMVLSVVLTIALVLFQRRVIRKTGSVAIEADHLHYKGDLLMNIAVFAALALGMISPWPYFDPIFATAIALGILYGAFGIGKSSVDILMDREIAEEDRQKILSLVRAVEEVHCVHDLRTRSTGDRIFIEFHLELDGEMTLIRAHDVTEKVEEILYAAFPKSEVLIHQEPAGIDDHRLDNVIS